MTVLSVAVLACQSPGGTPATAGSTSAAGRPEPSAAPPSATVDTPTVGQLVERSPTSGTYVVEGFIAKVYACPPCPPGAACKPCMGDNVVLSDEPKLINGYSDLGARDLIVFVPSRADLDRLIPGRRFRLTVRVRGTRSTSRSSNDVELMSIDAAR